MEGLGFMYFHGQIMCVMACVDRWRDTVVQGEGDVSPESFEMAKFIFSNFSEWRPCTQSCNTRHLYAFFMLLTLVPYMSSSYVSLLCRFSCSSFGYSIPPSRTPLPPLPHLPPGAHRFLVVLICAPQLHNFDPFGDARFFAFSSTNPWWRNGHFPSGNSHSPKARDAYRL